MIMVVALTAWMSADARGEVENYTADGGGKCDFTWSGAEVAAALEE